MLACGRSTSQHRVTLQILHLHVFALLTSKALTVGTDLSLPCAICQRPETYGAAISTPKSQYLPHTAVQLDARAMAVVDRPHTTCCASSMQGLPPQQQREETSAALAASVSQFFRGHRPGVVHRNKFRGLHRVPRQHGQLWQSSNRTTSNCFWLKLSMLCPFAAVGACSGGQG